MTERRHLIDRGHSTPGLDCAILTVAVVVDPRAQVLASRSLCRGVRASLCE